MTLETLLSGLSTADKLHAMDLLWRDLSSNPSGFASPDWHGKVLAERQANPSAGERMPIEEAIADIKERLNARRTES